MMQLVQAMGDVNVLDAAGLPAYDLQLGATYLLYDHEAGYGMRDGAIRRVASLDERLPAYRGEHLTTERIFLPFIGGRGDAIVAG